MSQTHQVPTLLSDDHALNTAIYLSLHLYCGPESDRWACTVLTSIALKISESLPVWLLGVMLINLNQYNSGHSISHLPRMSLRLVLYCFMVLLVSCSEKRGTRRKCRPLLLHHGRIYSASLASRQETSEIALLQHLLRTLFAAWFSSAERSRFSSPVSFGMPISITGKIFAPCFCLRKQFKLYGASGQLTGLIISTAKYSKTA